MTHFKLSITDFAVPIIRLGSLSRESIFSTLDFGIAIHQKIQEKNHKKAGSTYESEVQLKTSFEHKGHQFTLSGRADGIFRVEDEVLIEEIKSTGSPRKLQAKIENDPFHPYQLQTLTYGYIYHKNNGILPKLTLLIVSIKDDGKKSIKLDIPLDLNNFETYLSERCDQIVKEHKRLKALYKKRKDLSQKVVFPFTKPRPFQDKLMSSILTICKQGETALIQAPTGIGKTMGTIVPSLGEALHRSAPLWYLTPKNSQFHVVSDSLKQLQKSVSIKGFFLTSRQKICLNAEVICDENHCPYAKDFFTKIHQHQLIPKLRKKKNLNRRELRAIGKKYEVCPYYLGFEVIEDFDLVVGDYNYVFSPRATLTSTLTTMKKKARPNLLVDEAHNLYTRGIDYFSPSIDLLGWPDAIDETKLNKRWQQIKTTATHFFQQLTPSPMRTEKVKPDKGSLQAICQSLTEFLFLYLTENDDITEEDPILNIFFKWTGFLEVFEQAGDESFVLFRQEDHSIKIVCCNAAPFLATTIAEFNSVIGFSATLKPFDFFRTLSGFQETSRTIEFETPFPDENRKLIVIPQVSTKYRSRQRQYPKIAEAIHRITALNPGHYFVFGPSYKFIKDLAVHLEGHSNQITIQTQAMTTKDIRVIEDQLDCSESERIILAVQGGSLAEGVDFHSPYFKGVFVVGPALPSFDLESQMRKDYYEEKFHDGFNYSFVYPAMSRSIQAAGRIIRSEEKKGLIVLMDNRFLDPDYEKTMPSFWYEESIKERAETGILKSIEAFWNQEQPSLTP